MTNQIGRVAYGYLKKAIAQKFLSPLLSFFVLSNCLLPLSILADEINKEPKIYSDSEEKKPNTGRNASSFKLTEEILDQLTQPKTGFIPVRNLARPTSTALDKQEHAAGECIERSREPVEDWQYIVASDCLTPEQQIEVRRSGTKRDFWIAVLASLREERAKIEEMPKRWAEEDRLQDELRASIDFPELEKGMDEDIESMIAISEGEEKEVWKEFRRELREERIRSDSEDAAERQREALRQIGALNNWRTENDRCVRSVDALLSR